MELTEPMSTIFEVVARDMEIVADGITTHVTLDGPTATIVASTSRVILLKFISYDAHY